MANNVLSHCGVALGWVGRIWEGVESATRQGYEGCGWSLLEDFQRKKVVGDVVVTERITGNHRTSQSTRAGEDRRELFTEPVLLFEASGEGNGCRLPRSWAKFHDPVPNWGAVCPLSLHRTLGAPE